MLEADIIFDRLPLIMLIELPLALKTFPVNFK